jgi:PAS domain S-box-containing protein
VVAETLCPPDTELDALLGEPARRAERPDEVAEALADARLADAQLLRALIDVVPGAVYRAHNVGAPDRLGPWRLTFASAQIEGLTGRQLPDLMSDAEGFRRLIHPQDVVAYWRDLEQCLVLGVPFRRTYRLVHPGGEERWVWEESRGVYDADGTLRAMQGFLSDVTERRRSEAARSDEARAAGVRTAARTFEHELRNVLAVTAGYSELIARDAALPERHQRRAAKAHRGAVEAARIIHQLVEVTTADPPAELDWGEHGRTLRVRD